MERKCYTQLLSRLVTKETSGFMFEMTIPVELVTPSLMNIDHKSMLSVTTQTKSMII